MYRMTGNRRILERQYDSMAAWCRYIIDTAEKRRGAPELPEEIDRFLWNTGFHFGEWLIPSEKKGLSHREACEGSAFYTAPIFGYLSVCIMAEIAKLLGKAEAGYYLSIAEKMKAAIQRVLIRDGALDTKNMGAYVLMIVLDLVPEDCKAVFAEKLVFLLEQHHGCLDTGFLATPFLLDAFTKIGRRDLAVSLLWQTKMPSWLYEVEQGATAIWESWDAIQPDAEPNVTSYDHYAFGCVDAWIFENVAGIRALEPGFRRVEISPEPEGLPLEFCRRSFRCEYGTIRVFWNQKVLKVSIPCGVTAVVCWKRQKTEIGSGDYEMKKYLAIDIGASSGRHIVGWREDGEIRTEEIYRFPNGMTEQKGHLIWDMEALLGHVKAGIDKALSEFPDIVSLSIDTWGCDYVLLQGDREVWPCYAYRDSRTEGVIDSLHAKILFAELYAHTGCQFQPFNTVYQLYADEQAGRLEGVTDFLMIPEYLMWKLTGVKVKEYTNATTTGLVNATTGEFDRSLLERLGLSAGLFPKLSQPGTVIGAYKGVKVVLCATHDTASAVEGIPIEGNQPYISSGTWSLLGVKTLKPLTDKGSQAGNWSNEGGVGYNRYQKNIMGI